LLGVCYVNIVYKEWLPDQPALNNPGLVRATNVLPSESGYRPFHPLDTSLGTVGTSAADDTLFANGSDKSTDTVYVAAGDIYTSLHGSSTFTSRGGNTVGTYGGMVQFDSFVIAVGEGHVPFVHTVGSASNFSTLTSTRTVSGANCVGVINRFVVIGDLLSIPFTTTSLHSPATIEWSAIDDPSNWPLPGSATATAFQAGQQDLHLAYGQVMAIHGGDQYGLILQSGAVTRMTYEGPPTVFRFDVIDNTNGSYFKRGSISVGNVVYFISRQGFCRTNGVTVERIGFGKVDRFFYDTVNLSSGPPPALHCGFDRINNLVHFAFPTSAATVGSTCTGMMTYSPDANSWSYCDVSFDEIVTSHGGIAGQTTLGGLTRVGSNMIYGKFQSTAGSAILETGEMEFNEAGRTYLDSWKPLVESTATAPAITGRIGYRDDQQTSVSYTSTTSAFARTGVMNARVDAKYMRIETQIVGNFTKATGVECDPQPSSMA
jgi:hypothetical protein